MTATPKTTKGAQLRFRASEDQKRHLEQAAKDGGYKNLSDYLRKVVLSRHVVIVNEDGLVLIPAATSSAGEQAQVEDLLARALAVLKAGAAVPLEVPDVAPTPPGSVADQLAAVAAQAPPAPQASPGAADPVVGTSGGQPPAAPLHDPSAEAEAVVDAGPETPRMETCPACGGSFPAPISQTHSRADCEAMMSSRPLDGPPSHPLDEAELRAEGLEPDPQAPLGGPLPNEGYEAFRARRVHELTAAGRLSTVASAEADAEWRQHYASPTAGVPVPPPPPPVAQAASPLPARVCVHCQTVVVAGGACPTCGAVG